MNESDQIIVSVLMPTYNHESFINEAILGVLNQKTNFKFRLIIGDDCSTDGTSEICKNFADKFSDRINLVLHKKNQGGEGKVNFQSIYKMAYTKYIAICEGDDYWTDPFKLQKQVDFLEENPDYAICFTNSYIIKEDNDYLLNEENTLLHKSIPNRTILQEELLESNAIITLTTVFRNVKIKMPNWIQSVKFADWAIHVVNSQNGKIKYLEDCTAVYRKHQNGIFSSLTEAKQLIDYIESGFCIGKNLGKEISEKMKGGQRKRVNELLHIFIAERNWKYFLKYFFKFNNILGYKDKIKFFHKFFLQLFNIKKI